MRKGRNFSGTILASVRRGVAVFFTELGRLASIDYRALGRFLPTLGHKTNKLRRLSKGEFFLTVRRSEKFDC